MNALRPIVFDMDGVLVDTDEAWRQTRRDVALEHGGSWHPRAERDMQGVSTAEWSAYMARDLGVRLPAEEIAARVTAALERRYRASPPFLPGAPETVRRVAAAGHRLALASGSPRALILTLLQAGAIDHVFAVVLSSDDVRRGKPSPEVYLEAARRLRVDPASCIAVEDSGNGLRAAAAAGMEVLAVPNRHTPPDPEALALAARTAATLPELFADLDALGGGQTGSA